MSKKKKPETQLVVTWEPSGSGGTERFDWEDLDVEDEVEFDALDDQDRAQRIADALSERDNKVGLCYAVSAASSVKDKRP